MLRMSRELVEEMKGVRLKLDGMKHNALCVGTVGSLAPGGPVIVRTLLVERRPCVEMASNIGWSKVWARGAMMTHVYNHNSDFLVFVVCPDVFDTPRDGVIELTAFPPMHPDIDPSGLPAVESHIPLQGNALLSVRGTGYVQFATGLALNHRCPSPDGGKSGRDKMIPASVESWNDRVDISQSGVTS